MNLFDTIFINTILVIFPISMYFLYVVYTKVLEQKKSNLYFDIALISSSYFILKYSGFEIRTLIFIHIPLLIAYLKNRQVGILFLSVICVFSSYKIFNINIYFFVIEYLIYLILYLNIKNKNVFLNIILIIKWTILFICSLLLNIYEIKILIYLLVSLFILVYFIIYLFQKFDQLTTLSYTLEQVENDKKMYESLFKITHEIKNPIAVIKGYLDMFDYNNKNHSIKYIPIIKNEVDRVLVLLEDFLSINRLQIKKEIIDISYLVEEVISNFDLLLNNKQIKINFDEEEYYIEADYNRLKQVLVNVIKNSVEAIGEKGNIDIDIRIEKNKIYLNIKDNGPGMSKEEIEKLNYPFYTTKVNGTGLGVYLSKEIIKKHNGSMTYHNENGLKVVIKLPYDARLN